jgi:hypothetical protein
MTVLADRNRVFVSNRLLSCMLNLFMMVMRVVARLKIFIASLTGAGGCGSSDVRECVFSLGLRTASEALFLPTDASI